MNRPHRRNKPSHRRNGGAPPTRPQTAKNPPKRHHAPTQTAAPSEELIMGRNCVEEVLTSSPERVREAFIALKRDSEGVRLDPRRASLREKLEMLQVPVREVRREELDAMVQSESHQGVVARLAPRAMLTLEQLVARVSTQDEIAILALDGVLDPQNMGAILRAAECFGVSAVVWSKNRSAPLGPVVSKASVGASELVPLCPVSNLHRALEELKRAGAWSIGAVVSPDAIPLQSFEKPRKWVLIMGSEGEGLQRLIEDNLDFRVYISMLGVLSSLNVSQATAVILHSLSS